MVILAVGDFDEAVVGSLRIRVLGYGFRSLRIVISRAIGIGLAVRTLFPFDGIARDIAHIVAESNCARLIGRCLIADGRAVFRSYNRLIASCQCICRIFASRTASNTYRIHAIYTAVINYIILLIIGFTIATNRRRSCPQCIVRISAKYGRLYSISNIIAATTSRCISTRGGIIKSAEYSSLRTCSIVVFTADDRSVNARSNIVHATGCDTAPSRSQAVLAADCDRIITRSAIRYFRIILVARCIFCITAEDKSCIIHLYGYLFIAIMFFIRVVGSKIAIQADGVRFRICIGVNLDAKTCIVYTDLIGQSL